MSDVPSNDTRIRILNAADELFSKRGYSAVTLRDIAEAVGMRHASLYYYFPRKEGKAHLFLEVMERNFIRHREGLTRVIEEAGDDLREQVHAVARWFATQPPIDFARMAQADMVTLHQEKPQETERLMQLAFDSMRIPIATALQKAKQQGVIEVDDVDLAAMAIVSLVQSVHQIPESHAALRQRVGEQLSDMLLDGLLKR